MNMRYLYRAGLFKLAVGLTFFGAYYGSAYPTAAGIPRGEWEYVTAGFSVAFIILAMALAGVYGYTVNRE